MEQILAFSQSQRFRAHMARVWQVFQRLSGQVKNRWVLYSARSRQRRELESLSDHILKDIGISRVDALQEAEKPFWKR